MKTRPPYWKPPHDKCDLCGANLYQKPRYRAKLYLKTPRGHPLAAVPYKTMIVCQACLARLQASPELRGRFRLRHRRLPTLGAPREAKKNPGLRKYDLPRRRRTKII